MNPSLPLTLVGFMGCGKSTVGKRLAQALQCPLFDTDSMIEIRRGKSISAIFVEEGEEKFRDYEYRLLPELTQSPLPSVIVCGGGTPCFSDVMEILNAHTVTVYLQTPVSVLHARLRAEASQRPLVQGRKNPEAFIEELLAQREPFYRKAQLTLNTSGKSIEEIIEQIRCRLSI
jgi:shikimate kinase